MTVEGNGISMDTQVEAGVPSADLVIAVMSTDEQNLLSCLIAKRLGVGNTIARVRNPEYTSGLHLIQDDLGLSMALNPELASATESRASACPRPPSRSTHSQRAAWSCTRCASTPAPYSTA